MILGMDPWVFTSWIGTILSAIACLVYGVYHEYMKKSNKTTPHQRKKTPPEKIDKGKKEAK